MAQEKRSFTSEEMAKAMNTNAAVIRRIMAGLRDKGYLKSEKGHGGGWTLACDLAKINLLDIYNALGKPTLLAIGNRNENPDCLIEEAVNRALGKSFDDAEKLLLAKFAEISLQILVSEVQKKIKGRKKSLPEIFPYHQ